MKIDEYAFPSPRDSNSGMTFRQYAAVAALQGILADPSCGGSAEQTAQVAVNYADALIAVLNKNEN